MSEIDTLLRDLKLVLSKLILFLKMVPIVAKVTVISMVPL